jgi:hypothetical protein
MLSLFQNTAGPKRRFGKAFQKNLLFQNAITSFSAYTKVAFSRFDILKKPLFLSTNNKTPLFAALLCGLLMISCAGVRADIAIKADGSGTITLEYKISQLLENLGKLDGNERWSTVPAGAEDFRRTVERLDGIRLVSFASKTVANDEAQAAVINTVKLKFDNIDALTGFFDATGRQVSFVKENGKNRLTLIVIENNNNIDPDLLELFALVSKGFDFTLTMSVASGQAALAVLDGGGSPLDLADAKVSQGNPLSFSAPMGTLSSIKRGVTLEIVW